MGIEGRESQQSRRGSYTRTWAWGAVSGPIPPRAYTIPSAQKRVVQSSQPCLAGDSGPDGSLGQAQGWMETHVFVKNFVAHLKWELGELGFQLWPRPLQVKSRRQPI